MLSRALLFILLISGNAFAQKADAPKKKFMAVCSTTQVADFARQVVGDDWVIRCVLAPGQDPHTYNTTPADVALVSSADLCLANGMHLEGQHWMSSLAKDAGKPLVNCTDGITPRLIPDPEGNAKPIPDPHAWFSPPNAAVYVRNIYKAVSAIDPDNQSRFESRQKYYAAQLRAIDGWIRQQLNVLPVSQRKLVTSHDAFGYFCDRYGFESKAPEGWSTGAEVGGGPTFERRRDAIESIKSANVKAIFVETSVNPKLIREISKEANVRIGGTLYSDSMGTAGSAGETYLGMMRENVLTIVDALK